MDIDIMVIPAFAYLVAIIGAMIGGAGAIVAYLISTGMNYPNLKSWAKTEFREFLKTVLIIALAMFLILNVIHGIIGYLTGLSSSSIDDPMYYTKAESFIYFQYIDTMITVKDLMRMQAAIVGYSETKVTAGIPFFQIGIKPLKGLSLPASTVSTAVEGGIIASVAFLVLKVLLEFIKNTAFTVIFPIGIVMRAFPMTRKMGNTLIAFAIVAFFVLPTAILFNMWMYQNFNWEEVTYEGEDAPSYINSRSDLYSTLDENLMGGCTELYDEDIFEKFWDSTDTFVGGFKDEVLAWLPGFKSDGVVSWGLGKIGKIITLPLRFITGLGDLLLDTAETFLDANRGIRMIVSMYFDVLFGNHDYTKKLMANSFQASVDALTLSAKKLMFALLCLFLDWILVLSAFVSVSTALGGESSVFGIDKLKIW